MDSIRDALTAIKDLLAWLPDPAVALVILALAICIALVLHKILRPARAPNPGHAVSK